MTANDMPANGGPKVAFFDFTSCEGCQLTVVDSLQTHPELLQVVQIVQFREAMSERGEDYQIAFIEGSCTRQSDEPRLQKIRKQAAVVVALGACAHLGGVNSLKALHPLEEVRQYVYGDQANHYETYEARPAPPARAPEGPDHRERPQPRAAGHRASARRPAWVRAGCCAAVGALARDGSGEELWILVERTRSAALGDDEIADAVRRRTLERSGLRAARVIVLEPGTLPRTSSGKIRRREALRLFERGELTPPDRVSLPRLGLEMWRSLRAFARARG